MSSDISKTIEIIFGAKDTGVGNVVSAIGQDLNSLTNGVSQVTGPLSDVADVALKTEAAIIAMGVAMLGVAVNESAELSKAVNEIGTLFNATPDQVDKMRDAIQSYASDSSFAFEDITSATYNMISATGDAEGAVNALKAAELAAIVGNSSLTDSVNALTTITNSYGLELTSSTDVMGAFIIAVQNGKTTLPELANAIGNVASIAASSKVPFDDLLAAVAALTAGGIKTSEAMTGLKALFKALADPSTELKAALGNTRLETDGLQAVMIKLKVATGGSFAAMNELMPSIEATNSALILANDSAGVFGHTLEAMSEKATVVAKNYKLMEDDLSLVTKNMQNNLKIALQNIGVELLHGWTDIVQSISDIFKGVNVSLDSDNFKQVFTALQEFEVAVNDYLQGIAKVLPEALEGVDFDGIIEAFGGLNSEIGGLFGGLDLTKAEDLQKALQFLVDSVTSLTGFVTGITRSWGPALQTIKEFADDANKGGTKAKEMAGYIAGLGQQFEVFKGLVTGAAGALDLIGGALTLIAASTFVTALGAMAAPVIGLTAATAAGIGAIGFAVNEFSARVEGSDGIVTEWWNNLEFGGEKAKVAGVKVAELSEEVENLKDAASGEIELEINTDSAKEELSALSQWLEDFTPQVEDGFSIPIKLDSDGDVFSDLAGQFDVAGEKAGEFSDELLSLDSILGDAEKSGKDVAIAWGDQSKELDKAEKASLGYVETLKDGVRTFTQVGDGIGKVTKALSESEKETEAAKDRYAELQKTMLELASDERIKAMEFSANIEVANIEAQAKQIEAAFESVSESIGSTSELVGELFGQFADADFGYKRNQLEDAAKKAESRAEKALKLQEKLINAQVKNLDAKTKQLAEGGADIKITTEGLDPILDDLFRTLIDKLRLEIVSEGLEVLL